MKTQYFWKIQRIILFTFVIGLFVHCGGGRLEQSDKARYYETAEEADDGAMDMQEPVTKQEKTKTGEEEGEEQLNTEEYDRIIENPFLSPKHNPLTTFSVDVDKASYANVRRFLNNSQMPPHGAVRIEELINYFDYSYPQPTGDDPFSINFEMAPCYWNPSHHLLLIGLKGEEKALSEIPPANLVFLLDVSGSMDEENKLPLLKKSLKVLLEKLRPTDRVAIVVYAGAAGVVLPSTPCSEKEKIIDAFDDLSAGGSTAGGEGIELAYKIAKENYIEKGNNRVILATDGDFNIGQSSTDELVRMIEKKREQGVFLTVLGFGMYNLRDAMMEQLTNAGNGNYAYIDNILEAKKVLGDEMWRTLYTIAKDVKIQIEFNPGKVKAYRLIGYENRMMRNEDFHDDTKDAGDIGAGHTVTALYEIIPAGSDEKVPGVDELNYQKSEIVESDDLMTFKLRYKQPDSDQSKLLEQKVKQSEIYVEQPSDNFEFAAAVAQFGMLLRDSEYKGEADFKQVKKLAKQGQGQDPFSYRSEFIRLVDIAEMLKEGNTD